MLRTRAANPHQRKREHAEQVAGCLLFQPLTTEAYHLTMQGLKKQRQGHAIIILKQIQKHEWIFEYPRLTEDAYDRLETAIDWMDSSARAAKAHFRNLIKDYPEFLDAYHHLALTWHRQGRLKKAAELWEEATALALKLFPGHFSMKRDRLIWGFIENRPFLRLYHSYGLSLLRKGETEKALGVFENLVCLNPNDNQGARALVAQCNFELRRPHPVLAICAQYPNDALEELLYGKVLALLQLGKLKQASKALRWALGFLPLVGQELVKSTHRRPKDFSERSVIHGSKGQAYGYWKEFGRFWKQTPGAIAFVRQHVQGGSKPKN